MTELTELIKAGEGYKLEFKESLGKIGKEMVIFANASGGRILLEVADDGSVRGYDDNNTNRSRLQSIARNCEPPIEIEMKPLEGILVVAVKEGDNKPYSCGGMFYIRQGPNSQRMSREEIFALAVYDGTIRYDSQIHPRFRYPEDLDERKFEQYLGVAGIARPERPEALLQSLGVCSDEMRFNNAGVRRSVRSDHYDFLRNRVFTFSKISVSKDCPLSCHRCSCIKDTTHIRSGDFVCYEVIVIDCSRMPPDMEGMKEYLEEYIVPDQCSGSCALGFTSPLRHIRRKRSFRGFRCILQWANLPPFM